MPLSTKVLVAAGLLTILLAFGLSDALIGRPELPWDGPVPEEQDASSSSSGPAMSSAMSEADSSPASSETSTPRPEGVKKMEGPDVAVTAQAMGFTVSDPSSVEESLLERIIPAETADVQTVLLLKDGDRAGLLSFVSSPAVKVYYLSLKEALHASFSPGLRDLVDEKQNRPDRPPRDFLSFLDPSISEERLVFVRVRDRLYELHVAKSQQEAVFGLLEELTK